ncbi:helix-turn-helix domain-containing protein [Rossellomorea sp. BNER]|uniref:helix-turn-helix domain-containing protein n=1 Tax=Rossellomorea sp. BNER TaxID=2962031 RepID=UPI003AF21D7F|nr:helix-turn-helix domain-containing protein [Rossellomorea sp. BNER]
MQLSGKEVKGILKNRGIKAMWLGKEVGLKQANLSHWLNGRIGEIPKSKYYRILEVLGLED